MKFMVNRVPVYAGCGVEVRIFEPPNGNHSAGYIEFPTMHTISEGEIIPAALSLSDSDAQQLSDALWEAGIRPSNGEGSTGQLAAVTAHLNDMRTLVFKKVVKS